MDFKVDRSKWKAGEVSSYGIGKGITALLNSEGFMCCLGHCALQIGYSEEDIFEVVMPCGLTAEKVKKTKDDILAKINNESFYFRRYVKDTGLSAKAASINDSSKLTTDEKETKLKEMFKEYGHTISFYGKSISYKD